MRRNYNIIIILTLLLLSLPWSLKATDREDIIVSVRNRNIMLDESRFPDTILAQFAHEEQEEIANQLKAIHAETTIVLEDGVYSYVVPSNFYIPLAAVLNGDYQNDQQYALAYVPIEDYGMAFSYQTGRPTQFSYFNDSVIFDKSTDTEDDEVTLKYFAHADSLLAAGASMTIPEEYRSLLVDLIVDRCLQRQLIKPMADPAPTQKGVTLVRPADNR